MRSAATFAKDLRDRKPGTFMGLVRRVKDIQRDAFSAGQKATLQPLQALSWEVERRLAALNASSDDSSKG